MAGHHREIDPSIPGREQAARARADRKRRSRMLPRPNSWFAFLIDSVADDQEARGDLPDLSPEEILAWADAYHAREGRWPRWNSGPIPEAPGETWLTVEAALTLGLRGFPKLWTLLAFLAEHWRRSLDEQPEFTVDQILAWADAWYERTGKRPIQTSGNIPGADGINWKNVDNALRTGRANLPAGFSLRRLLTATRGLFHLRDQPRLTEDQILDWADAHYQRTGTWPTRDAGWIAEASGEAWNRVDEALIQGVRGLPGGSSIVRLLAKWRGVRNKADLPPFHEEQILAWADAWHERSGQWPAPESGPIPEALGETWMRVDSALKNGTRGLWGGSSLTRLLAARRGIRNPSQLPQLTISQVLAWADSFHERTGRWPTGESGPVVEAPGETWQAITSALHGGLRGLPDGSSLARLLARERGARNDMGLPPFQISEILRWADSYHACNGTWPKCESGPIPEAPGETWRRVQEALSKGRRGLPGGESLARLLVRGAGANCY